MASRLRWLLVALAALAAIVAVAHASETFDSQQALSELSSFGDAESELSAQLSGASAVEDQLEQQTEAEFGVDAESEGEGSLDLGAEVDTEALAQALAEADAESESEGEGESESESESEGESEGEAESDADSEADAATETESESEEGSSLLEVDASVDRRHRRRRRHRRYSAPKPAAHAAHSGDSSDCVRWGHGQGYWKKIDKKKKNKKIKHRKHKKGGFFRKMGRKIRRFFGGRKHRGGHRHRGHRWGGRHHRGGHRRHWGGRRHHWGGRRHHWGGHRHWGRHHRHHWGGHRHHWGGHRHHWGGHRHHWGGHRHHHHHHWGGHRSFAAAVSRGGGGGGGYRGGGGGGGGGGRGGGGRRRFFLQLDEEVTPSAVAVADKEHSLVEAEAKTETEATAAAEATAEAERRRRRRRRRRGGRGGHGSRKGYVWVPGPMQCLEYAAPVPPVDAPAPPSPPNPPEVPWCDKNVWMQSASYSFRLAYATRCLPPVPPPVPAPKAPAARIDWCKENEKLKQTASASYYYQKCGGAPPPPPVPKKPRGIPKPPKEDPEKWCNDFSYLRYTGARTYFCSKCPMRCEADRPAPPPRPAGVPAAPPRSSPQRRNWCVDNGWMRYGRHSDYFFSKCGGRPPEQKPAPPPQLPAAPPRSQPEKRRDWCEENNFLRFSKKYAPFFYSKCGGLVPAIPEKKPSCHAKIAWAIATINWGNRAFKCADYLWMKANDNYRPCYCSKCSCPSDALPPARPDFVIQPPEQRSDRLGWCQQYLYLRHHVHEYYYCDRCGCSEFRQNITAPADFPAEASKVNEWCQTHSQNRFYPETGLTTTAIFFYEKCGAVPQVAPKPPAKIAQLVARMPPPPLPPHVVPTPAQQVAVWDWCAENKKLKDSAATKDWYCSKCACPIPPPPPPRAVAAAVVREDFCDVNRWMIKGPQADFYYAKCGGKPEPPKEEAKKPEQTVHIAPPAEGSHQVHVHVNMAAPKAKTSNEGLKAMVARINNKNMQAAAKMDAILDKLRSQDCRGGDCLPQAHAKMPSWKAEWILETEETGKSV